jgi:two-component system, sensor histidine kinase and response regulator
MHEGPLRCLLVSEGDDDLGALEEAVRAPDVEPRRARSCGEALASTEGAALAIVDALAPGVEGPGLGELARGAGSALPLIVLDAGPYDQERARLAYEAGAVDVLFRPLDARALRHKALVFFELERQRRRLAAASARAREADEGRLRAEGELRDARAWHETFVAIVGHDLRNPLNAILVGAQLVGRSTDENARRLAGHIGASGQRLSDLVDDLCDVARARQGLRGFAVDPEDADLAVVVGTVVAELKAAHPSRALILECRGDLTGRFDRGAIARVASNLVGNALRHGSDDAPIDIKLEAHDEAFAIEIENAGTIGPELVPFLFDPFRVAQETTRQGSRGPGLGLGLYISRQLLQAHGGELRVFSYGGLTRVVALLPRHPPPEPANVR